MNDYEVAKYNEWIRLNDDLHTEKMRTQYIKQELAIYEVTKPTITKDGNQWCVLLGGNLQEGIAGFGDSPYDAILDYNKAFHNKDNK